MNTKSTTTQERIFLSAPHMSGKELEYVRQAFASNYIAPVGPQLNQFEKTFRELTGYQHCVAVGSGTAGIHVALRTMGVKAGDVVLASTLTFIGSVSAAYHLGAELVFVDSDRATWNMDPNMLADEIKRMISIGKKPAAVLPTEIYGQPCDLDLFREICDPHGIPILSDSAESLGASYKDQFVGKSAKAAVFSFNGNKIITTSGGGMVASDDKELVEHCRYLSTQARQPVLEYEHLDVGYNYRMSNVVAAIGIGQLEVLMDRVEKKRQIHEWYHRQLGGLDGIDFIPESEYGRSNRWLTVMTIDPKTGKTPMDVINALEAENIESRPVWKPMHLQPVFASNRCVSGAIAEEMHQRGVCLPSGTIMTENDVERVSEIVRTTLLSS